ncbi:MAG TPA: DUF418 domain-containing protein [Bryobacterales bacterium]|nr:DUF418 domain-containing protein [Bryobacterales bacterium]
MSEHQLQPVAPPERIQVIDVLRGVALFGIIAANMRGFNAPARVYGSPELMWSGTADRIVQSFIDVFISGKFITLFSFLFGLGFAVQMSRAEAKGANFVSFYARRMSILLVIGLVHSFLIWWGDILVTYALLGFALLLFRKRSQKTVMAWALGLLSVFMLLGLVFMVLVRFGVHIPAPSNPTPEQIQQTVRIYGRGSIGQIMVERAGDVRRQYTAPFYFASVLGVFLLGLYVWRRGIFQDVPAHLALIRKWLWIFLAVGLAGNVGAWLIGVLLHPPPQPNLANLLRWGIAYTIGVPALSCFYASGVVLLFQKPAWQKRLLPFAAVGRMALSNYLLQSVVCTLLYYSYGFGLYGKVGPAMGLIPTLVIYGAQIPLSAWWLRRYQFGPMEWLWRSLSYGYFQSMRIGRVAVGGPSPAGAA